MIIEDGYHIWPLHYGEHKAMHRVAYVKDGSVIFERIFETLEQAEEYIKKNESV
jgi:hypothetical protein